MDDFRPPAHLPDPDEPPSLPPALSDGRSPPHAPTSKPAAPPRPAVPMRAIGVLSRRGAATGVPRRCPPPLPWWRCISPGSPRPGKNHPRSAARSLPSPIPTNARPDRAASRPRRPGHRRGAGRHPPLPPHPARPQKPPRRRISFCSLRSIDGDRLACAFRSIVITESV